MFMVAIVDSGFWFAFFDKKDSYHKYTDSIIKKLDECADKIVIPWPSLYEVLNESFLKRNEWKFFFDTNVKKGKFIFEDDSPYQKEALLLSIENKKCSLVDAIINLMIEKQQKIDALVTFNTPDFEAAKKRSIAIIDENFSS